jgi:hypothetical protein
MVMYVEKKQCSSLSCSHYELTNTSSTFLSQLQNIYLSVWVGETLLMLLSEQGVGWDLCNNRSRFICTLFLASCHTAHTHTPATTTFLWLLYLRENITREASKYNCQPNPLSPPSQLHFLSLSLFFIFLLLSRFSTGRTLTS